MVEQVKTGVDGLDSVLNGGVVRNSTVLISGTPGSGKSILGLEFLYHGVEEFDEPGIYLTFEETAVDLQEAAESIGLDNWGEHVESETIKVYDKRDLLREESFSDTLDIVLDDIQDEYYERLVLDSLTMFNLFFETEKQQRRYLLKFVDILEQHGLTSLMTNEQAALFPKTEIGLENFLTDGNIYLVQSPAGSRGHRYLWVAKMRKQPTKNDLFPMEITGEGIKVYEDTVGFPEVDGLI